MKDFNYITCNIKYICISLFAILTFSTVLIYILANVFITGIANFYLSLYLFRAASDATKHEEYQHLLGDRFVSYDPDKDELHITEK